MKKPFGLAAAKRRRSGNGPRDNGFGELLLRLSFCCIPVEHARHA
jgi:hypothetical protein